MFVGAFSYRLPLFNNFPYNRKHFALARFHRYFSFTLRINFRDATKNGSPETVRTTFADFCAAAANKPWQVERVLQAFSVQYGKVLIPLKWLHYSALKHEGPRLLTVFGLPAPGL